MYQLEAIKERIRFRLNPLSSEIYTNPQSAGFIHQDSRVIIIGPGLDEDKLTFPPYGPMDRSSLVLAPYLAKGRGSITFLDAPDGDRVYGAHSTSMLKTFFAEMRDHIAICDVDFVETRILMDPQPELEPYDGLVDHLTAINWLILPGPYEDRERSAGLVRDYYLKLLKPDGKLILHYPEHRKETAAIMKKILAQEFSRVRDFKVKDEYRLTEEIWHYLLSRKLELNTVNFLSQSLKSYYPGYGVIIAQR